MRLKPIQTLTEEGWLADLAESCKCCSYCGECPCGGCQQGAPCDALECTCDGFGGELDLDDEEDTEDVWTDDDGASW